MIIYVNECLDNPTKVTFQSCQKCCQLETAFGGLRKGGRSCRKHFFHVRFVSRRNVKGNKLFTVVDARFRHPNKQRQ
jgi:hypothetical protein